VSLAPLSGGTPPRQGTQLRPASLEVLKAKLLERNIFVRDRRTADRRVLWFGRALIKAVAARRSRDSARAAGVFAPPTAFAASAEQNQIIGNDLGLVHLLAGFFVVPGTGAQAALDVALAAFFRYWPIISASF